MVFEHERLDFNGACANPAHTMAETSTVRVTFVMCGGLVVERRGGLFVECGDEVASSSNVTCL